MNPAVPHEYLPIFAMFRPANLKSVFPFTLSSKILTMQAYQTVSTYFIILNFDKVNVDRDHVLCLVIKEPLFVVDLK